MTASCRLLVRPEITEAQALAWGLPWEDGAWWIPKDTDLYTVLVLKDLGHDSVLSELVLSHLRKYPYDVGRTKDNTIT